MNNKEACMVQLLRTLKDSYGAIGVKAEFEAEGTRIEEAMRLKEIATKAELPLIMKIGGCEAITDMYMAKMLGVKRIVAPMIESKYALRKFIESIRKVFPADEHNRMSFLINIETITGVENLESILELSDNPLFDGVVIGRGDLAGSMNLTRKNVDDDVVMAAVNRVSELVARKNLLVVVGGGITVDSIPVLEKMPFINQYETRKVLFGKYTKDPAKGIMKALRFEQMWLENKRDYYKAISEEDLGRLASMEERLGK